MSTSQPTLRRLVACPQCALQYDAVGHSPPGRFHCACGALVVVEAAPFAEAAVVRCSACGAARRDGATTCEHCRADFTLHERDLYTICPGCMTRISDQARHCHACGLAIAPQGAVGELTSRPCPVCAGDHHLYSRNVEGAITVLECDHCAGLWVGHLIFELLERDAERLFENWGEAGTDGEIDPAAGQPGERFYRACVLCDKLMHRRNYGRHSGVIVDVCREHGIWFDRGELERILGWLRDGGRQRAALREAPVRPALETGPAATLGDLLGPPTGESPAMEFVDLLLDALVRFFSRR